MLLYDSMLPFHHLFYCSISLNSIGFFLKTVHNALFFCSAKKSNPLQSSYCIFFLPCFVHNVLRPMNSTDQKSFLFSCQTTKKYSKRFALSIEKLYFSLLFRIIFLIGSLRNALLISAIYSADWFSCRYVPGVTPYCFLKIRLK